MMHSPEDRQVGQHGAQEAFSAPARKACLTWASLAGVLLLAAGGCNRPWANPWQADAAPPAPAEQTAPSPVASPVTIPVAESAPPARPDRPIVTTFTFDVLRVRVPRGLFSGSGKIWNHLETDLLSAESANLLHRNGLRAARADAESWPPIRAILETEPHVETAQSQLTMSNGLPLLLELDQRPRDQILFLYRRNGTLAGAPWRASTNVLRIDYGIPPSRAEAVMLEVAPELRLDSPAATALRGAEHWDPNVAPQRNRVIHELSFRVELGPGQSLVVGPSSATHELPYIMGALLFCEETGGDAFESMYFITPTAKRTGG